MAYKYFRFALKSSTPLEVMELSRNHGLRYDMRNIHLTAVNLRGILYLLRQVGGNYLYGYC